MSLDRRSLLVGAGTLGALTVAFVLWPKMPASPLRALREGERVFGPYVRIARDGRVTLAVPQVETGQGVWTALAMALADELGADWEQVGVEPAPMSDDFYGNALLDGQRLTANSTSIRAFERPMREAGATARALLVEAAARRWGLDPEECRAHGGQVTAPGRTLSFGELVEEAARIGRPVRAAVMGAIGDGGITGQIRPRVDAAAKSSGAWRFAGDVRLPQMLHASIRLAPPGGRLSDYDRRAAKEAKGVRIVERDGWIAALGETWWAAEQALSRLEPVWSANASADTPSIEAALVAALDKGDFGWRHDAGDYAAATAGSRPIAATYVVAPAPHRALETPAAAAQVTGGRAEVWAWGRPAEGTTHYPMGSGDPDGGPRDNPAISIAMELAREAGRPVSLVFPTAVAQHHDALRPPLVARMSALGADGGLASWRARLAGAPGLGDAFEPSGAIPPYAIPAQWIEAVAPRQPLRFAYMRGDVDALAAFATESFVDEMARVRGVDPLTFRIGMLGASPRLAAVLMEAAQAGGWDGGGAGSAMGIACASAYGSHIGLLAEANIGPDQRVAVTRLVAAVDCGRKIAPALVRQQIEAGLIAATGVATGPAPAIVGGMVRARPVGSLGLSKLGPLPKVTVKMIVNREAPGGVSGLAPMVTAAAIGNALAAATGQRLRRLPFDPMTPA